MGSDVLWSLDLKHKPLNPISTPKAETLNPKPNALNLTPPALNPFAAMLSRPSKRAAASCGWDAASVNNNNCVYRLRV